jgi:hypothetical protein
MTRIPSSDQKTVFWHRDLPPVDAQLIGEHTVEATSGRVAGHVARGDVLWDRCYEELMANAHDRLAQEMKRLHGDYAHVTDESIESQRDDAKSEGWLHGVFTYGLYRRP